MSALLSSTIAAVPNVTQTINDSKGFATSAGLKLNGLLDSGAASPTVITGGHLRLADTTKSQRRSAFTTTRFPIASFSTTFTFQDVLTSSSTDGMTFTLQNSAPTALGGTGGSLGYGTIPQSIAIKFDLFKNYNFGDPSNNCTGLFTDGAAPEGGIDLGAAGISLHSGDPMRATLSYKGTTLTESLTDTKTNKTFTHSYTVNIPAIIGGNYAYVGFTAASGSRPCIQDILTWTYTGTSPATGTVSGTVFNDLNGNGKLDSTEKGLANWTVYADANNDGKFESTEAHALTDSAGNYFLTLPAGTYVIRARHRPPIS